MSDRRTFTLGELVKFKGGSVFPKEAQGQAHGDLPFAKVSDMNASANWQSLIEAENWLSTSEARKLKASVHEVGAVAFAKIGIALTYNRRRKIVRPTLLDNNMMSAQPIAGKLDSNFLYYLLQTVDFNEVSAGSALPYLTIGSLSKITVSVPSIGEQCGIASTLGSLDDKIELNRRMNETLEAMAQAIFRDWFVDFGPTRRKIDGATDPIEIMGGVVTDPNRARTLADLFPASMSDDGLAEGWVEGDLGHYALLNPENWSARSTPSEVEYIDLANTKWGTIETTTVYRWSDAPSRARRIVRKGDTIVGTVRPGNGSYSYIGIDGLTASTGFAALRPRRKAMAELVYLAATSGDNIARLDMLADGGAYPAVRPDVVLATSLPIVPPDTVDGFASVCAPLIGRIEHNKKENCTLAATRDLLLPKLMSGEIRLRDLSADV